jgi:hypothetical protein
MISITLFAAVAEKRIGWNHSARSDALMFHSISGVVMCNFLLASTGKSSKTIKLASGILLSDGRLFS